MKVLSLSEQLERTHACIRRLTDDFPGRNTSQSLEEHADGSTQALIDLQETVTKWEREKKENRDKARVIAAEVAAVVRGEEEEVTALELSLMRAEQRLSVKEAAMNALSP
jgi:hypothetical protein